VCNAAGIPVQYANGVIVIKAEDHADLKVPVSGKDWTSGRLPAQGSFRLPPNSLAVAVMDWVRVYPAASAGGLLALLMGTVLAYRWRKTAQTSAAEVKVLHSQLDTSGDPLIGKLMGRYRVEARLGQGGMGSVYKVSDDVGTYAAKVIYFETLDSQSVDRFRREFKLLSQLQHPTFPRCFDYHEKDGMAFQVMELVSGQTLRQIMRPGGVPWTTVRPWVLSMLDGLECAHSQGIVHRDLKPENIMVSGEQVKILDFGIARQAQVTAITMTGQAFGTPQYVAPEQVYGSSTEVDSRTDLYSLGVIVYELLAGHPPFQADDVQELVSMHLSSPVPPLPPELGLPEGVAGVLEVLLSKNPANRYPSARRVKEVLEGLSGGSSSKVDVTGTMAVPRRRPPQMATPARIESEDSTGPAGTINLPRRRAAAPPRESEPDQTSS
jgi:serine/threonine-protein kinase